MSVLFTCNAAWNLKKYSSRLNPTPSREPVIFTVSQGLKVNVAIHTITMVQQQEMKSDKFSHTLK